MYRHYMNSLTWTNYYKNKHLLDFFQLLAHYNCQMYITSNKVAKAIRFKSHRFPSNKTVKQHKKVKELLVTMYADLLYSDLFLFILSMNPYRLSSITWSKLPDKHLSLKSVSCLACCSSSFSCNVSKFVM